MATDKPNHSSSQLFLAITLTSITRKVLASSLSALSLCNIWSPWLTVDVAGRSDRGRRRMTMGGTWVLLLLHLTSVLTILHLSIDDATPQYWRCYTSVSMTWANNINTPLQFSLPYRDATTQYWRHGGRTTPMQCALQGHTTRPRGSGTGTLKVELLCILQYIDRFQKTDSRGKDHKCQIGWKGNVTEQCEHMCFISHLKTSSANVVYHL